MNEETLTALQGSIAKWQGIVDGTLKDEGTNNCALCQMFMDRTGYNEEGKYQSICFGCPVAEQSKETGCDNTPYNRWEKLRRYQDPSPFANTPEKVSAAQEEVDYLRSLLP